MRFELTTCHITIHWVYILITFKIIELTTCHIMIDTIISWHFRLMLISKYNKWRKSAKQRRSFITDFKNFTAYPLRQPPNKNTTENWKTSRVKVAGLCECRALTAGCSDV